MDRQIEYDPHARERAAAARLAAVMTRVETARLRTMCTADRGAADVALKAWRAAMQQRASLESQLAVARLRVRQLDSAHLGLAEELMVHRDANAVLAEQLSATFDRLAECQAELEATRRELACLNAEMQEILGSRAVDLSA